jgi:hypothetical protein
MTFILMHVYDSFSIKAKPLLGILSSLCYGHDLKMLVHQSVMYVNDVVVGMSLKKFK